MAQYRVLKRFRDVHTKEVYAEGQEIEMTVKRADEAARNLKNHGGEFLERIFDVDQEENQEEEKED